MFVSRSSVDGYTATWPQLSGVLSMPADDVRQRRMATDTSPVPAATQATTAEASRVIATATRPDPLTQGWFNHGAKILELVEQHKPKVCVELGTWLGASAIPVARSIRRWGGTLTCIDTWAGELNADGGSPAGKPPLMLLSCARNIVQAGVNGSVRLIPATTIEAAAHWTQLIDWLYIDADHSYEGCLADLTAWVPHIRPGGVILGDDYGNDMYPGVRQAWDVFERAHGLMLTRYQSHPPDLHGIQLIYGITREIESLPKTGGKLAWEKRAG